MWQTKVLTQCAKISNESSAFESLWEASVKQIFSNSKRNLELGLGEDGTSTYFSSNCTKADAEKIQKFLDDNKISAYNTRLFKTDGEKPRYEVQVAAAEHGSKEYDTEFGTVVVKQGDMAPYCCKFHIACCITSPRGSGGRRCDVPAVVPHWSTGSPMNLP